MSAPDDAARGSRRASEYLLGRLNDAARDLQELDEAIDEAHLPRETRLKWLRLLTRAQQELDDCRLVVPTLGERPLCRQRRRA